MADEEDLRRLKEGNQDLTSCDFRNAILPGVDLSGRDLSNALFEGANLTHANLRGAQLEGCHFTGANLSKADLAGCSLYRTQIVSANFTGANLRNIYFSSPRNNQSATRTLHRVKFDGADIRGASFRNIHFDENCSFDDAFFDESTDFEGVKVLRAQARLPVFSHYEFEKGALRRKTPSALSPLPIEYTEPPAPPAPIELELNAPKPVSPDNLSDGDEQLKGKGENSVSKEFEGYSKRVFVVVETLSKRIDFELESLAYHKPNDPEALEIYNGYVEFLRHIVKQLAEISKSLEVLKAAPLVERSAGISAASHSLDSLGKAIADWAKENGAATLKAGINVGGVALGTLALNTLDVDAHTSAMISAAFFGGQEVITSVTGGKKSAEKAE